ncbi:MAG: hypothetical protein HY717_04910 [Planctomycetes bacterium]|nr:hypothetical protein [Planctomycetota bacterium]
MIRSKRGLKHFLLYVTAVLVASGTFAAAQEKKAPVSSATRPAAEAKAPAEVKKGAPPAEPKPVVGVEKNRPFIQTPDGKFRVEFGTTLQPRYTFQGRDVNRGNRASGHDKSFGELERARLNMTGHFFDPRIAFRVEFDGHSDGGSGSSSSAELVEAYLQYKWHNKDGTYRSAVGAGQWKPYFGRQEKTSSTRQLLVDRSLANEYFNIDRNVGIWVEGRKDLAKEGFFNGIGYEVSLTNGFDSINVRPTSNEIDQVPAFVAHIDLDVMGNLGQDALSSGDLNRSRNPSLTVGSSFATDQNNDSSGAAANTEWKVYQIAEDFVFKYQGFSVNGEYFGRWLDFKGSDIAGGEGKGFGSAIFTYGGYLEAGYMIGDILNYLWGVEALKELQVAGRASAIWNEEGPSNGNSVEAGGGLNYFIYRHNLKLSMDVLYLDISPDSPPQTEELPGLTDANSTQGGFQFKSFSSSSANLEEFQGVMARFQAQVAF